MKSKKFQLVFAVLSSSMIVTACNGGGGGGKEVSYDETNELFGETQSYIKEMINCSNYTVKVGEDYNTTLSIKDEVQSSHKFEKEYFKVETYTEENGMKELKVDEDYTLTWDESASKVDVKVLRAAFNNKIYITPALCTTTIDDFVTFNDLNLRYNTKAQDVKFSIPEGKTDLPEGTKVYYDYVDEDGNFQEISYTKGTGEEKHPTFTKIGTYEVTLSLLSPVVYAWSSKTITVKIAKGNLTEEEISKIKFSKTILRKDKGEKVEIENTNVGDAQHSSCTIMYKVDNDWTKEVPNEIGTYEVKALLEFVCLNSYTMNGTCQVVPRAEISVKFDVKSAEAYWDKEYKYNDDIDTDKIVVPTEGVPFKTFKANAEITENPYKKNCIFEGWYRTDTQEKVEDETIITDEAGFTVVPKFTDKKYKVNVSYNTGAGITYETDKNEGIFNEEVTLTVKVIGDNYELKYLSVEGKKYYFDDNKKVKFKILDHDTTAIIVTKIKDVEINYVYDESRIEVTGDKQITGEKQFKFKYTNKPDYTIYKIYYYGESEESAYEIVGAKEGQDYTVTMGKDDSWCSIVLISIANTHKLSFHGGDLNDDKVKLPEAFDYYYNLGLKDVIDEYGLTATHEYGGFKGWSKDGTNIITNETMPSEDTELKALWYKYNFVFESTDKATVSVEKPEEFTNRIYLDNDDFNKVKVTANSGYTFNHQYDVYMVKEDQKEELVASHWFTGTVLAPATKFETPVLKDGVTFKLRPVCSPTLYKVSFNDDGGYIDHHSLTEIPFGSNIKQKLKDFNVTASYSSTAHWTEGNWYYYTDGMTKSEEVGDDTTMPDKNITLKPKWDTYTFKLDNEGLNETFTTVHNEVSNLYQVRLSDFGIKPIDGYVYDHIEYSFDSGEKYTEHYNHTDPFRPYSYKSDLTNGATIYIKVVCKSTVDVFLNANGGEFNDGSNVKIITIKTGMKWRDITNLIETPWKSKAYLECWTLEEGSEEPIPDDHVFDGPTMIFARYTEYGI